VVIEIFIKYPGGTVPLEWRLLIYIYIYIYVYIMYIQVLLKVLYYNIIHTYI
jgi:hypothetical protein